MIAEISKMSPASRVWIYQADREFTPAESERILEEGMHFIQSWTAHENPLLAGFTLKYNRFIVFAIDDSIEGASGCSIDKSVHLVRKFEKDFGVSLLNRLNVAYRADGKIFSCSKNEFESLLKAGKLNEQTIVFNNMVASLADFNKNWEVSLANSWHKDLM